jgi:Protein of unknown function (DUF1706)
MNHEQWVPGSTPELISAIEREWKLFMRLIENLDEKRMSTPDKGGWSPKDNLAHLAEWMKILMGYHMDRRPAHEVMGVAEEVTKGWDMEIINPVLFERNRDRSSMEILNWAKQVYAELLDRLTSMPFEELLIQRHADDPEKRPLLLWVLGNTTEHFEEHRLNIEKSFRE